jgi:hypothetical protein
MGVHTFTPKIENRRPVNPSRPPCMRPRRFAPGALFRGLVPLSDGVETFAEWRPLVAEKKFAKWSISRLAGPPLQSSPPSRRCMRPRRFAPGALFSELVPLSDCSETLAKWCPLVADKKIERWSISKKADFGGPRGGALWSRPS